MTIYEVIKYCGRNLLIRKVGDNWQVEVEDAKIVSAIFQEKDDAIKDAQAIADRYR